MHRQTGLIHARFALTKNIGYMTAHLSQRTEKRLVQARHLNKRGPYIGDTSKYDAPRHRTTTGCDSANDQRYNRQPQFQRSQYHRNDRHNQKKMITEEKQAGPSQIKSHKAAEGGPSGTAKQGTLLFPKESELLQQQKFPPTQHASPPVMLVKK